MAKLVRHRTDNKGQYIKNPTRYYSSNQEQQVAKNTGLRLTKNSGATLFEKGDLLGSNILLECKTKTEKCKSFSIKKEWIDKNRQEQITMLKPYSAIAFNYGPDEELFYVIDEKLFKILLSRLENNNE